MRLIISLICAVIVGCSVPTNENRCCTDGTCVGCMWMDKAQCLERFVDSLEHELEITKLKIHYECKDGTKYRGLQNFVVR